MGEVQKLPGALSGGTAARGARSRRCVLVAVVLGAATIVYLCGAALPFAEEDALRNDVRTLDAQQQPEPVITHQEEEEEVSSIAGFVVATPGCRIPDLDARSPLVKKYVSALEPRPKCEEQWSPLKGKLKQRGPPLVASNLTALWVVRSALSHYNISRPDQLSCCYRPFVRQTQQPGKYNSKADNMYNMSSKCIPFSGESALLEAENEEYVRVECSTLSSNVSNNATAHTPREIYRDFHAFIPIKRKVEERCMQTDHQPDQVSVLILGVDAVSRLNMERELPQLRQVLLSPPLSAIPLLGYNKVGDNTFPNVVPLLTGLAESQLAQACSWRDAKTKIDACPFIWRLFAERGYRTAYGEDCTWMSTFNYAKTGFVQPPVDYYARPFLQASESEQGHTKRWNVKLCVGPRMALANILGYANKFCSRFAHERSFAFFWSNSVSHDFLTMPHNGDALYASFLQELLQRRALDRTVLLVLSDHGIRWGGIRETFQGRLEERLPFAYLSFPKWFGERFPAAVANVRRNARNRLTTPFDLHETLLDLLDPTRFLNADTLKDRIRELVTEDLYSAGNDSESGELKKGVSLFLPISANRTCREAHIPPHFCTCQESSPLSTEEPQVQRSVGFVLSQLNDKLRRYRQCAQLTLVTTHSAQRKVPLEETNQSTSLVDYLVVFETRPGGAVFEATVRESPPLSNNGTSTLQLAGDVSRINRYGEQSRCVADFHMKLYCYCG